MKKDYEKCTYKDNTTVRLDIISKCTNIWTVRDCKGFQFQVPSNYLLLLSDLKEITNKLNKSK